MNEESIFLEALAKDDPSERERFLAEACAGDTAQRERIEKLLMAHPEAGNFLEQPGVPIVGTVDCPPAEPAETEQPGVVLAGRYKLLEAIGEGGMGTVWMARQTEPVKRLVAIKLIKPGMDSRAVLARFEAERQALALMDHPHIAKVHDAGAGPDGRPFFVMELVKGVPLTTYCDECRLTPRQRLELFVPVCSAIQHAHHKGIIHRDVKPSNVLVALYDDRPVVKVIDFGVAKATGQPLTEQSVHTGFGSVVGTVEYMSPEQASLNQLDVDTRSDVYALGVLLYELLTGTTPLEHQRVQEAGILEALRLILEEETPTLSQRLSTTQELTSVAARRGLEPARLSRLVRGELDWIVMKALEKDRSRRYETANAFALDVQRYLADEPVLACPPSATYRLCKFVRRNKRPLATAAALGLALLVAVGAVAGSLGWVARDREARQMRLAGKVDTILDQVDRLMKEEKWPEALVMAKRAEAAVATGEADPTTRESVRQVLADLRFVQQLEELRLRSSIWKGTSFDYEGTDQAYGEAFRQNGVDVDALSETEAAAKLGSRRRIVIPLAVALDNWADSRRNTAKRGDTSWKRLVAVARRVDPDPLRNQLRELWGRKVTAEIQREVVELTGAERLLDQPPTTLVLLAHTLGRVGLEEKAVTLLRRVQQSHSEDFWGNFQLAVMLARQNPGDGDVVRFYSAALALRPDNLAVLNNLGNALRKGGRVDEAVACYQRAIALDPEFAFAHINLGHALMEKGELDRAIACCEKVIEFNPDHLLAHFDLAVALSGRGRVDEAIEHYREILRRWPKRADWPRGWKPNMASVRHNLFLLLEKQGKLAETVTELRSAVRRKPNDAEARLLLGHALFSQRDAERAELLSAVRRNPKDSEARRKLRRAHYKQHDAEAAKHLRAAIRLKAKERYWAYRSLGLILLRDPGQAKYDEEAADAFRGVIREVPQPSEISGQAHLNLGMLLLREEKWAEAEEALREGTRLCPHESWGYSQLARHLALCPDKSRRKPTEAITYAKKAIDLQPNNPYFLADLGVAQYAAGQWSEALATLTKADQMIDSGDHRHRFFLAMAQWRTGNKQQARTSLEQAVHWMEAHPGLAGNAEFLRSRTEAEELIGIRQPWHHLIKAREYAKRGERDKAAAEHKAAIDGRPNDPQMRIARGRFYAELGEHQKADADFARAAALTPDGLYPFLQDGWWAIGPFHTKPDVWSPPEVKPDPSKPAHVVDAACRLSKEPVRWVQVPLSPDRKVDLRQAFDPSTNGAVYALAYVYSPDERNVPIRMDHQGGFRLWLNGEYVYSSDERNSGRVAVVLRPGRNVLLVRASEPAPFGLWLGDSPMEKCLWFALHNLWDEANRLFLGPAGTELQHDDRRWVRFVPLPLLLGDRAEYLRLCQEFYESASRSPARHSLLLDVLVLAPNDLFAKHAAALLPSTEQSVAAWKNGKSLANWQHDKLITLAWVYYRLDKLKQAEECLGRLQSAPLKDRVTDPLRAMIAHRRGDQQAASKYLRQAGELDLTTWSRWRWYQALRFLILYREAEELIDGSVRHSGAMIQQLQMDARRRWKARDKQTWAFDRVVHMPRNWLRNRLRRVQRYAQLGRFDEALADFRIAKNREKTPLPGYLRLAAILAENKQWDRAAEVYLHLLKQDLRKSTPSGSWRQHVCEELSRWDDVFTRVVQQRPRDADLWIGRGRSHVLKGDWKRALADYAKAIDLRKHTASVESACLLLLLGDRPGYEQFCQQHAGFTDHDAVLRIGALAPQSVLPLTELVQRAQAVVDKQPTAQSLRVLSLSHYRAGQFDLAMQRARQANEKTPTWSSTVLSGLVLAMTEHQQGQTIKARDTLATAVRTAEFSREKMPVSSWLEYEVLRREAEELLRIKRSKEKDRR
jgi:tetratricopeptide (TPR) repeat protein